MPLTRRSLLASSLVLVGCADKPPNPPGSRLLPAPELAPLAPPAPREFRAAWVATVANIDWPSRKGLSTAEQQAEMRALLDSAAALGLNAIIFQVRTAADALYDSALEPWSEYLSGTQGQAPEPFYDPLALWIKEAHRRGLELHAWFNPFRARQSGARSTLAATHLGRTHPAWIRSYGDQLWIDPGEPEAADHTLAVLMDVLQRYDVDGIHIDDYFYPYAVNDKDGRTELDFPDEPSWQRYLNVAPTPVNTQAAPRGGEITLGSGSAGDLQRRAKLSRADWRRQNVSTLVERIWQAVRGSSKPWVRFGISPFGLGKPALRPPGISGYSQYDKLYADVELWLERGWLDYLAPQLYWPRAQAPQAFGPLLHYWRAQNPLGRHIWPGLFTSKVLAADKPDSWPVEEILGQIALQRELAPQTGHAHFSMIALAQNRRGLADALKAGPYAEPALVPATPWLDSMAGGEAPMAVAHASSPDAEGCVTLDFSGSAAPQYAVWLRHGEAGSERWSFHTGAQVRTPVQGLSAIVVSALDRVGREGPRAAWNLG